MHKQVFLLADRHYSDRFNRSWRKWWEQCRSVDDARRDWLDGGKQNRNSDIRCQRPGRYDHLGGPEPIHIARGDRPVRAHRERGQLFHSHHGCEHYPDYVVRMGMGRRMGLGLGWRLGRWRRVELQRHNRTLRRGPHWQSVPH